jgi:hypothetical protein
MKMVTYADLLSNNIPTGSNSSMNLNNRMIDSYLAAQIMNSSRYTPPSDRITLPELETWWNKKKQELLKDFEKIVEQKINDYVNFNGERQKIHFTNNQ